MQWFFQYYQYYIVLLRLTHYIIHLIKVYKHNKWERIDILQVYYIYEQCIFKWRIQLHINITNNNLTYFENCMPMFKNYSRLVKRNAPRTRVRWALSSTRIPPTTIKCQSSCPRHDIFFPSKLVVDLFFSKI